MNNILVTGGAGFIGMNLVPKLLLTGHKVRVLDKLSTQIHGDLPTDLIWLREHTNLEFIRGTILDEETLTKSLLGIDTVIHLAAETGTGQSMYEINKYCNENVIATATLCETISKHYQRKIKRIVLTSSRSIYGEGAYERKTDNQRIIPEPREITNLRNKVWEPLCTDTGSILNCLATKETDAGKPGSIYASTKLMQENLIAITCRTLKISSLILRLQNVYGEGQSLCNPYTGILSIFSTKIRNKNEISLYEDGLATRDFVHVDDVVQAILKCVALDQQISDVFNVGSGQQITIKQVAEELINAFGAELRYKTTGQYRMGDIRHNFADLEKIKKHLDYKVEVPFAEGIKRFVNWVDNQPIASDKLEDAQNKMLTSGIMG
ncbi:NAD-dependent epimerase/dehydratase family protein [Planktomarina temperata]|nr:NAD-dependent epimerase/dehydratase family protein [Planktomarina temperata]